MRQKYPLSGRVEARSKILYSTPQLSGLWKGAVPPETVADPDADADADPDAAARATLSDESDSPVSSSRPQRSLSR